MCNRAAKIFIITVVSLAILTAGCASIREASLKGKGVEVVSSIESFRTKNSRLPADLSEIGVSNTEEGPIYYQKKDESSYIVWFGARLGESETYDSKTRNWSP